MNGATQDDTAFFDAVYQEHHRVVYAYLLGQCGNSESAEDLLQETFLRVWRHLPDIRSVPAERKRFYIFAIARNLALDELRRRMVRQRSMALPESIPQQAQTADPVYTVIAQETVSAVDDAIQQLQPDLRIVLSMHLIGEMNSFEIASALGIPASTVRYRLARARRGIIEQLETEGVK